MDRLLDNAAFKSYLLHMNTTKMMPGFSLSASGMSIFGTIIFYSTLKDLAQVNFIMFLLKMLSVQIRQL